MINHVGIIPDGNRRWAKEKGLNSWEGHKEGAKRIKEILEKAQELKIQNITIYTFSTENFKRDKLEVKFLFKLFKKYFSDLKDDNNLIGTDARVRFVGDKDLFPKEINDMMIKLEDKTKDNSQITVNFAMGYGGRSELIKGIKKSLKEGIDVNEENFSKNLDINEDFDLIIRTSGEKRLSNFFPWQSVYAELIFLDQYWPDFTKTDFESCIKSFLTRNRRFGQ